MLTIYEKFTGYRLMTQLDVFRLHDVYYWILELWRNWIRFCVFPCSMSIQVIIALFLDLIIAEGFAGFTKDVDGGLLRGHEVHLGISLQPLKKILPHLFSITGKRIIFVTLSFLHHIYHHSFIFIRY